ncbi:sensor domain-containing phosphodiesterase [Fictibacillus barbaricus]|uniref:Diguanylate cyclase (GGDEF)-like protein/PAS domain S-box-containing protein n=1 Tax=Fictibacillus barbaricus TaxID=182136 RepID=A0ABU1U3T1_9BACL|nr:EAL domain-containing protein [Fictibacillus barbaricus]MDR7074134.1 diguanylate cyclase (GGDEF)-like protein/PAS domain S-box-containing protein [Fictibacillus barbaricus]
MFQIEDQTEIDTLFNGFLDMMFLMKIDADNQFRYAAANDAALKYAGLTRDAIGKRMQDVLNEELASKLQNFYEKTLHSKQPVHFQTESENNGKLQVAETYITPILNKHGECTFLLAAVKDLTEAKIIAAKLEETEEQYRLLYAEQKNVESQLIGQKLILEMIAKGSNLQDVFRAISLNFEAAMPRSQVCIHLANERDQKLEYAFSSRLPEIFIQEIHQIEISPVEESCGRAAYSYTPVILKDIANEMKNNKKKKMALKHGVKACWSHPILSSSNQLLGILAVYFKHPASPDENEWRTMEAFTHLAGLAIEQKQKEEALRKSEAKFRAMTENITDLIVTLDTAGKVKYTSPSYRHIFGIEANLGNSFLTYTHPDDIDFVSKMFSKLLRDKKPLEVQFRYMHQNGGYIPIEARAMPVLKESGEIENIVVIARDITKRNKHEEVIKRMAYYDQLTGLPNRRSFSEEFESFLSKADENNQQLGILFLDIDRFKFINDSLGHTFGDLVLKEVSLRLKKFTKGCGRIYRMSGDEFTIILENINLSKMNESMSQLLNLFSEPLYIMEEMIRITASIGVSVYPCDSGDPNVLLRNADLAMYRAKENGKNTYQYYQSGFNSNSYERLLMENELHNAIENNELILHYQPRYSIKKERILAVEALIRWNHPRWGMISPGEFIPLAEETGLITKIGAWVMETACMQTKEWIDKGYPNVKMAVNLSARQFLQRDLVTFIQSVIEKTEIPPQLLELEITESTLMKYEETIFFTIDLLKEMGVQFALDDFGTGYSSLGYLKKFRIDTLKIDQSFVRGIGTETDDSAIATAIITLAHSLKMNVVAEGVETEQQYQYLKEQKCNEIQGFYKCRPMDASNIEVLLSNQMKNNMNKQIVLK